MPGGALPKERPDRDDEVSSQEASATRLGKRVGRALGILIGKRKPPQTATDQSLYPHLDKPAANQMHPEASVLAAEAREAFSHLAQEQPGLVFAFKEAFDQRAQIPELSEARGLSATLADLLWGPVPQSYFENPRQPVPAMREAAESAFVEQFGQALQNVAAEDPHVLFAVKQYQEETGRSLEDVLRALFLLYVENKNVYPF